MGDQELGQGIPPGLDERIRRQFDHLRMLEPQLSVSTLITLGFELEMWIVDALGRPVHRCNIKIRKRLGDKRVVVEMGSMQLEMNITPVAATGSPFTAMLHEMEQIKRAIEKRLKHGQRVVFIGTLPTFTPDDIDMTPAERYQLISRRVWEGQPVRTVHIPDGLGGSRPMKFRRVPEVIRCTSAQGHLLVPFKDFVNAHNVALATAGVVHSMAANATFLDGRPAGHDIRDKIFYGATNGRADVNLGYISTWWEPFARAIDFQRFPIILAPDSDDEDFVEVLASGGVPKFKSLRTHNGTAWKMAVRAVYEPDDSAPHVRLELRYPSAAPPLQALAVYAFAFGLVLSPQLRHIWRRMPYDQAVNNFSNPGAFGAETQLWWPGRDFVNARQLATDLLPLAHDGLTSAGVNTSEATRYLDIIGGIADTGQTGAAWQRRTYHALLREHRRRDALSLTTVAYANHSDRGLPFHEWPVTT
jgi:gamma-glutamylcysteine synthetase